MADFRYFQVPTRTGDRFYRVDPDVTYRAVCVWLDGQWRQTVFDTVDEMLALLGARGVLKNGARQVSAEEVPEPGDTRITVADRFGGAPR